MRGMAARPGWRTSGAAFRWNRIGAPNRTDTGIFSPLTGARSDCFLSYLGG